MSFLLNVSNIQGVQSKFFSIHSTQKNSNSLPIRFILVRSAGKTTTLLEMFRALSLSLQRGNSENAHVVDYDEITA